MDTLRAQDTPADGSRRLAAVKDVPDWAVDYWVAKVREGTPLDAVLADIRVFIEDEIFVEQASSRLSAG